MIEMSDRTVVLEATGRWLERSVIGLNLCPFAAVPWRQGRVRLQVSEASNLQQLVEDLADALLALNAAEPSELETTLLIHPEVPGDFLEYNDFLDIADRMLEELHLDGTIQVASFHPQYRFADTEADDPAHCTNRSPYPMLHLLREASIEAAVANHSDPDAIYERNIRKLREIGMAAWGRLVER
jgi:hypothetical protein